MTPDPAGLAAVDPSNPQTWNRYAYVANNPLNYIDPLGLQMCPDCQDTGGTPGGLRKDDGITYYIDGFKVSAELGANYLQRGFGVICLNGDCGGYGSRWVVTGDHYMILSRSEHVDLGKLDDTYHIFHSSTWIDVGSVAFWNSVVAANNGPFSVSVYLPFARRVGGYTFTYTHIAAKGQPTYNCSSHSGTISTPAAKAAISGGPLTLFGQRPTMLRMLYLAGGGISPYRPLLGWVTK